MFLDCSEWKFRKSKSCLCGIFAPKNKSAGEVQIPLHHCKFGRPQAWINVCLSLTGYYDVVAYSGWGAMVWLPPWSDSEFVDNFCTVFVSFISRWNRKICVPRLLVTVRVFCLLEIESFLGGTINDVFLGRAAGPFTTTNTSRHRDLRRLVSSLLKFLILHCYDGNAHICYDTLSGCEKVICVPVALPASTLANTPAEGNQRFHLRTESLWTPVTKPGRTPPITPTWAFKP